MPPEKPAHEVDAERFAKSVSRVGANQLPLIAKGGNVTTVIVNEPALREGLRLPADRERSLRALASLASVGTHASTHVFAMSSPGKKENVQIHFSQQPPVEGLYHSARGTFHTKGAQIESVLAGRRFVHHLQEVYGIEPSSAEFSENGARVVLPELEIQDTLGFPTLQKPADLLKRRADLIRFARHFIPTGHKVHVAVDPELPQKPGAKPSGPLIIYFLNAP